jgi:hypothetical protein
VKERQEDKKKPRNRLAFPPRQESWESDQIWRCLTPWERKQVRTHDLQLNVVEPNWRAPSHD